MNDIKEIVIPKEKAVFWLDKAGCWRGVNGKFEHRKIIDYFHSCIERDANGYYLTQQNGNCREKVYFHYEDQALFVFDVMKQDEIILVLNTRKHVSLRPEDLFIKQDNLYMRMGDEIIKFAERALSSLAPLLEENQERFFIRIREHRYPILSL